MPTSRKGLAEDWLYNGVNHYTLNGMCCFFGYDANGDPCYIDPAAQSVERRSVTETISIHPIQ